MKPAELLSFHLINLRSAEYLHVSQTEPYGETRQSGLIGSVIIIELSINKYRMGSSSLSW